MRKLSITLLLIALSFMTMEANCLSSHRGKYIQLKIWDNLKKGIVFIPIEAILEGDNIKVQFLEKQDKSVTFQIKDNNGNIVFQNMMIPNEQETYIINLDSFKAGQYELLYIEEDMTLIGEFRIE